MEMPKPMNEIRLSKLIKPSLISSSLDGICWKKKKKKKSH